MNERNHGPRSADEPTERQTFISSYIVDDLLLISMALDRRDAGTALSQYLTASPRTDVQKEALHVRSGCAPDRIPPGRWVTGTDRRLAFSQQFAVNQILRTLTAAGQWISRASQQDLARLPGPVGPAGRPVPGAGRS